MIDRRNTLRDAVFRGDLREVESVLVDENQVDRIDEDNRTALLHAVIDRQADIAAYLIEQGADVDHRDAIGYSALHYAVQVGSIGIVSMLI